MSKPFNKPHTLLSIKRDTVSSARRNVLARVSFVLICFCFGVFPAVAQTPPDAVQATGVLRLRVRPKIDGKSKGLGRKRFYLIKGGLEENKALVEQLNRQAFPTRDCYYKSLNASEAFIKWLVEGDCESVFCRQIEEKYLTGPDAVPEFQAAYARSAREYRSPELGRLWLTTNLAGELADGFYRRKQVALDSLINAARAATGSQVISVMTDRFGTAYFTNLLPGNYFVTNLLPVELGDKEILWMCDVEIKPGDLATERPFQLSNMEERNVKCVGVEKPLPACDANKQAAHE